jgi:hypothetical protein
MAYNNSDEGKYSEYNSAALKMKRLHDILSLMNGVRANLLAFNDDFGRYNYEIFYEYCTSLYQEVRAQCSEEERKEGDKLRNVLGLLLEKLKVWSPRKTKIYPYTQRKNKFMETHWRKIKEWLTEYEDLVRKLQDAHGMDTLYNEAGLF